MKQRIALLMLAAAPAAALAGPPEDDLLEAVRKGDVAAVRATLDRGAAVDAKYRYDRTALSFAADRGQLDVVTLLLERGADPDVEDTFYHNTAMGWAATKGHVEVVRALLARSRKSPAGALLAAMFGNQPAAFDAILASGRVSARDQSYLLQAAEKNASAAIAEILRARGVALPPPANATIEPALLARYAARYRNEADEKEELRLTVADGRLVGEFGGRSFPLDAIDATHFQHPVAPGVTLEVLLEGERVAGAVVTEIGSEERYRRVEEAKP
jgi:hypothetical protein